MKMHQNCKPLIGISNYRRENNWLICPADFQSGRAERDTRSYMHHWFKNLQRISNFSSSINAQKLIGLQAISLFYLITIISPIEHPEPSKLMQ